MKCEECYLGILRNYSETDIVTIEEIKDDIEWSKKQQLKDYFDRRKNFGFTFFNYCPFCGKEIKKDDYIK